MIRHGEESAPLNQCGHVCVCMVTYSEYTYDSESCMFEDVFVH